MYYWAPNVSPSVWIGVFFVLPILFNLLNVRRIGGIEFTFTTIKVFTLVGLVILGMVIIAGGVDGPSLTGLDSNIRPVPCDQNNSTMGACVSNLGFNCLNLQNYL
jgi:amino acid permease